ncbi:hypothetical protein SCHPADRAFT_318884 [Schizopora paradoxa]|uniref:Uncharacterized protein n=1 Tax=Schizopora paradoxa TaxID=27342 RepID=A0A0H2RR09_9AGAM|nr:hypothetical protein SCHPADRAFT_318884 [Schizopora paradoxa]
METIETYTSNSALDQRIARKDNVASGRPLSGNDTSFSPPFLVDVWEEDAPARYSYYSTVSTNFTMSNLPGPGRLLGNLYSWAGSSLEHRVGKLVNRKALKAYAEMVSRFQAGTKIHGTIWSTDVGENEKICETLLQLARSNDTMIQLQAFEEIIVLYVLFPSQVRSTFASIFQRRKEVSDAIAFCWKRPSVEYGFGWLLWYRLASRCLSSSPNLTVQASAKFSHMLSRSLEFSIFEELLSSCRYD